MDSHVLQAMSACKSLIPCLDSEDEDADPEEEDAEDKVSESDPDESVPDHHAGDCSLPAKPT
jgi:hypothetical protein